MPDKTLQIKGLPEFKEALKKFSQKVNETPVTAAKKLALNISMQTILNSNVDTGRMIGGWEISTGNTASFPDGESFIEFAEITNPDQFKNQRIDKMTSKIDRIKNPKSGKLWFANNVKYTIYQEFGTEKMDGTFALTNAIASTTQRALELIKEAS